MNTLYLPEIREMLAESDEAGLAEFCSALHPARTAEFMEGLSADEAWRVLQFADPETREEIFNYFDPDITLHDAIWAKGGGVNKIARHGTAGLLNALHPAVNYPFTPEEVIAAVQAGDVDGLVYYNEMTVPGFCD